MPDQNEKAKLFKALHVAGRPFVLYNIWDAGSAKAVASAGAAALATGSWSVAAAHGLPDGERLTLELALANLKRIVAVTDLPVTIDIESGYGDPAATIEHVIDAGAIGCNLEDSFPQDGTLREVSAQVTQIREARRVADASATGFFINARTDVFLQRENDSTDASLLSAAIERAHAYVDAGADGIFVPGLQSVDLARKLAASLSVPINIMVGAGSASWKDYAEAGVARISHGPSPYLEAMNALADAARNAVNAPC